MSANSHRQIVIGDVHGYYEGLMTLLSAIAPCCDDQVYFLGDLIDRGPDSVELVEFFTQEPGCYTILGNHEYMSFTPMWQQTWLHNGGPTTIESCEKHGKDINWLRDTLQPLPWVIEVGDIDQDKCFRVVHADYEPHWSDEYAEYSLNNATDEDGYFDGEDFGVSAMLWSRHTIGWAQDNVKHMKPIHYEMDFHPDRKRHNYVGHSGVRKATTVKDITFLDTMWMGKCLTMVEVMSGEVYTIGLDI